MSIFNLFLQIHTPGLQEAPIKVLHLCHQDDDSNLWSCENSQTFIWRNHSNQVQTFKMSGQYLPLKLSLLGLKNRGELSNRLNHTGKEKEVWKQGWDPVGLPDLDRQAVTSQSARHCDNRQGTEDSNSDKCSGVKPQKSQEKKSMRNWRSTRAWRTNWKEYRK